MLTKLAYCSNYFSPHAGILLQLLTLHHWQTQKQARDAGWSLTLVSRLSLPRVNLVPSTQTKPTKPQNHQHIPLWHPSTVYKQAVTGTHFHHLDKEVSSV